MSLIEMASAGKFRYHKLRPETGFDGETRDRAVINVRPKKWHRFRRIHTRRRFRLKVPSLRRLWRKKAMMVSAMRRSCAKVMKRLKEGQVHFGDLFAGNYLFMQINPASLAYLEREITLSCLV
ncbi:uncharacterized protein LOC129306963 [Prosopis cineraria]|uniref:uncharacterized protein LOC129306963 n=1 Tax=Prosopis cineraria TaxID=364024 RepID=UPI00240F5B8E|nr:uncharacterized protein LOC129306963 [Prosopis cineraria]